MRTSQVRPGRADAATNFGPGAGVPSFGPAHLPWVTSQELQGLRAALARGQVPPDLEAKLLSLANGGLVLRYIEKHCRTIIALLQATYDGSFREASPQDLERLLWVLAYVRKDDDAIADYRSDGFADDQHELRQVVSTLDPILQEFKAWRLRHQVPGMWQGSKIIRP